MHAATSRSLRCSPRNIWTLVEESGTSDKVPRLWLGVMQAEIRTESREPEVEQIYVDVSVLVKDVKRI